MEAYSNRVVAVFVDQDERSVRLVLIEAIDDQRLCRLDPYVSYVIHL